ncbi:MAG: hypothetical protein CL398_01165 [Acidiferrobacteraceae bacterium]|nr:hypothetical protein [Acidiferrobacteraceae bacterium]
MNITKGRLRQIIKEELRRADDASDAVSVITEGGEVLSLDPSQVIVGTDNNGNEVRIKASDIVKVL